MLGNNLLYVLGFYFAVGDTRLAGTDNIDQHFLLAHADAAGLLYLHVNQLAYSQLVQNSAHYFACAGSNTAGAHTYDNFGTFFFAQLNVRFQFFTQFM